MHFYHKSLICVTYHQIIRWVFILSFAVLFFMPEKVMSIEEDPYAFNMIRLGVGLTYESWRYGTSDRPQKTSSFEQRYSLDVRSRLIDPKLIVYNIGIEFVDTDVTTNDVESHRGADNYRFNSIRLRKSRMPLALTADRSTSETTFGGKTTRDNFGVDWYLKFKTLPWTRLTYDKTQTQATGRNEERESSGVVMTKAIGPTDNKISYSVDTTTDNIQNYSSEKTLYTFKNDTTLPLNSDFYLGMVNYNLLTSNGDVKDETDTTAGSMGLSTIRTAKFNQNYNYTFTKTEHSDDNRSTNADYFNGRIGYRPTKRLSTSL